MGRRPKINGAKIGSGVIEEADELASRADAALSPHHTFTPPPTCPLAAATHWICCGIGGIALCSSKARNQGRRALLKTVLSSGNHYSNELE